MVLSVVSFQEATTEGYPMHRIPILHSMVLIGLISIALSGCKPDGPPVGMNGLPLIRPTVLAWCGYIEQAGLADWADYGRALLDKRGGVRFVSGGVLPENYNAYTEYQAGEVWINKPMFARYSDPHDQGEIYLHELVHLRTGVMSHAGPWWAPVGLYRDFWRGK